MVNLPQHEEVDEEDINEIIRTMFNKEPKTLRELELLAQRTARRMNYATASATQENYARALSHLRQKYNMNFRMLCEVCYRTHGHDELEAPDR